MKKILMLLCVFFFVNLASAYNFYPFDLNTQSNSIQANNFTYTLLASGLVSVNHADNHLTNLGMALYGENPNPNYLLSWGTAWSWQVLENSDYNITVLGTMTHLGFTWSQEWFFQRYGKPKITHTLTNNTGTTITNMKMFYVLDVDETTVSNVTYYDNVNAPHQFTFDVTPDYELNQSINTSNGQLLFNVGEGAYFDFTDLFSNFDVIYLFAGNLSNANINLPNTQGIIFGFTKGNGTMLNGQTFIIDPVFDDFEDNDYTGTWDYTEVETTILLSYGTEESGFLQLRQNGAIGATARNTTAYFLQKDANSFTLNDFPIYIDFNMSGALGKGGAGSASTTSTIYLSDGGTDINFFSEIDSHIDGTIDSADRNITLTYTSANIITVKYCRDGSGCWEYTKNIAALDQTNLRMKFYKYTTLSAGGGGDTANCTECLLRISDMNYFPDTLDFNFLTPIENQTIVSNQDYNISWSIINGDTNAVGHLFDLNYGVTDANIVILNDGNVATTPGLWCDSNDFSSVTNCHYTWAAPDLNGDYYLKMRATSNTLAPADINKSIAFSMSTTYFLKIQYYDAISGVGVLPDSWIITGTDYVDDCDANGFCWIKDLNGWATQQRSITATKTGADNNIMQPTFGESQEFEAEATLTLRRTTITLINEDTGDAWNPPGDFNADDDSHIVNVIMYDINGGFVYDFNASGNYYSIEVPDTETAYNFEITYNNAGLEVKYKKEINLSLIDDTNSRICVAPLQNFYEQIFTSTKEKQIIVYLPISDCYTLAGNLRNIYQEGQFNNVYTINKTYQAYTFDSDGTQTFLAWVNGGSEYSHNLDAIEINKEEINIVAGYDTLAFVPLLDSSGTDLNILQIYFLSYYGNYTNTNLKIYDDLNTLIYEITEDINANEFVLNWDWNAYRFTDENLLQIIIVSSLGDGTTETFTEYFNISGNEFIESKDPTFIAIMTILFFLFGITLTSVGRTFGWFGIVICIASMAISVMALPGAFFIPLIQAGLFICFLFIFLNGGATKPVIRGLA